MSDLDDFLDLKDPAEEKLTPAAVERRWQSTPVEEKGELEELAERTWNEAMKYAESASAWHLLTPAQRAFACLAVRMIVSDESADPVKDTVKCVKCHDTLIVPSKKKRGDQMAWFCDCESGIRATAGYWFERCFPIDGQLGRRVKDLAALKEFDKYVYGNAHNGFQVRSTVQELLKTYNSRRQEMRANLGD